MLLRLILPSNKEFNPHSSIFTSKEIKIPMKICNHCKCARFLNQNVLNSEKNVRTHSVCRVQLFPALLLTTMCANVHQYLVSVYLGGLPIFSPVFTWHFPPVSQLDSAPTLLWSIHFRVLELNAFFYTVYHTHSVEKTWKLEKEVSGTNVLFF